MEHRQVGKVVSHCRGVPGLDAGREADRFEGCGFVMTALVDVVDAQFGGQAPDVVDRGRPAGQPSDQLDVLARAQRFDQVVILEHQADPPVLRRRGAAGTWREAPLTWLFVAGFVLVIASFVVMRLGGDQAKDLRYRPPAYVDGQIVPAGEAPAPARPPSPDGGAPAAE